MNINCERWSRSARSNQFENFDLARRGPWPGPGRAAGTEDAVRAFLDRPADQDRRAELLVHAFEPRGDVHGVAHRRVLPSRRAPTLPTTAAPVWMTVAGDELRQSGLAVARVEGVDAGLQRQRAAAAVVDWSGSALGAFHIA